MLVKEFVFSLNTKIKLPNIPEIAWFSKNLDKSKKTGKSMSLRNFLPA